MRPKKHINFSGSFLAEDCGNGGWCLRCTAPPAEVFLQGVAPAASPPFGSAPLTAVEVEWREQEAQLSFDSGGRTARVVARSAIVHEPLANLYDRLPLAAVDADARRFWRRVFRLMRIPGGRHLLKLLIRSRSA